MIVLEDNNLKGFECTGTLIWLYRIISLIELKCRAFSVVPASLRLSYVEGSASNQRALAQLVESMERSSQSPIAFPSIPNRASVNPQLRFRQSPIAFHQKHCFVPKSLLERFTVTRRLLNFQPESFGCSWMLWWMSGGFFFCFSFICEWKRLPLRSYSQKYK